MILYADYSRVSTLKEDQKNSFEAQQRYFREYVAQFPDFELYKSYADEGITGTSTKNRIEFNRMINDAYAGKFQMIITKDVSRFSRNILDTIAITRELKAIGVGVIFVNDHINTLEPEAEMLLSFLATLAQDESRRTSSRVVFGQTQQMKQGVVFGHSMLGYDVKDGKMTINPEGSELVKLIFQKYAVEQVSTTEIARYLMKEGYRTHSGNSEWTSNTVIKILKNEKYVGDLVQKKTYTPDFLTHEKRANKGEVPLITIENHHEAIVSREVWNMTQDRLRKNNKHVKGNGGHSNRYAFSGKIKCGKCGVGYIGRSKTKKDGTKIRRWSCGTAAKHGAEACGIGMLVRDDDAMEMLKTAIRNLPIDFESVISNVTELASKAIEVGDTGTRDDPKRLQVEIEQVRRKKEAMLDSYFSEEITKEEMEAMKGKYSRKIEELSQRKKEAELRQKENRDSKSLRETIRSELTGILDGEIESEVFSKNMVDNLTVFKDRHMELRLNYLPEVFLFAG